MDIRSIAAIQGVGIVIAILNVCISILKRRSRGLIALELASYVTWLICVLQLHISAISFLFGAMIGLVANTGISARLLRNREFDALNAFMFGKQLLTRIDLGKRRMAERERRAKEQGVTVLDILTQEKLNEDRSK